MNLRNAKRKLLTFDNNSAEKAKVSKQLVQISPRPCSSKSAQLSPVDFNGHKYKHILPRLTDSSGHTGSPFINLQKNTEKPLDNVLSSCLPTDQQSSSDSSMVNSTDHIDVKCELLETDETNLVENVSVTATCFSFKKQALLDTTIYDTNLHAAKLNSQSDELSQEKAMEVKSEELEIKQESRSIDDVRSMNMEEMISYIMLKNSSVENSSIPPICTPNCGIIPNVDKKCNINIKSENDKDDNSELDIVIDENTKKISHQEDCDVPNTEKNTIVEDNDNELNSNLDCDVTPLENSETKIAEFSQREISAELSPKQKVIQQYHNYQKQSDVDVFRPNSAPPVSGSIPTEDTDALSDLSGIDVPKSGQPIRGITTVPENPITDDEALIAVKKQNKKFYLNKRQPLNNWKNCSVDHCQPSLVRSTVFSEETSTYRLHSDTGTPVTQFFDYEETVACTKKQQSKQHLEKVYKNTHPCKIKPQAYNNWKNRLVDKCRGLAELVNGENVRTLSRRFDDIGVACQLQDFASNSACNTQFPTIKEKLVDMAKILATWPTANRLANWEYLFGVIEDATNEKKLEILQRFVYASWGRSESEQIQLETILNEMLDFCAQNDVYDDYRRAT